MENMIIREFTCPFCGKTHFVRFNFKDYQRWERGELAQVAFSNLSSTEREQIISHICPSCQTDIFDFEEDE